MDTPEAGSQSHEQSDSDISTRQLSWNVGSREIMEMPEDEFRQFLVETNERVRRLHDALILLADKAKTKDSLATYRSTETEIDIILHPENKTEVEELERWADQHDH